MEQKIQIVKNWLQTGSINIFGKPFSGKDTQGQRLADQLDAVFVAGGEILRARQDHPEVQRVMAEGGIISSDVYEEIVLPYLQQASLRGKSLILSSVGRSHGEEDAVMQTTSKSDHPIKAVVYLTIEESDIWHRFDARADNNDRRQRQDDSREALEVRLQKFSTQTLPVIEYYRNKGLLLEIDGSGNRDEVEQAIINQLATFAQAN